MRLDSNSRILLEKSFKSGVGFDAVSAFVEAIACAFVFGLLFFSFSFEVRHNSPSASLIVAILMIMITSFVTLATAVRFKQNRPISILFSFSVVLWGGLIGGYICGDRYWYSHTAKFFTYQEMASYVNINPSKDKGQSYMDAGVVYFNEGSEVNKSRAIAFHNGLTYCVAPIFHKPTMDASALKTVNGYALPGSGTVDFWAVGINCCGQNGDNFECGESKSRLARSGMRLLDETARSMYLLAVQEWSATTGLPVRHPLFFHWVVEPIGYMESFEQTAWNALLQNSVYCFVVGLMVACIIQFLFQKFRIL
jgi:hypothetical protein